jgi:hypothetical protein
MAMSDPDPSWLTRAWARIRGAAHPEPAQPREADAIHWVPMLGAPPYCGARFGGLWTVEPEAATCARCREEAAPLVLQYRVSTR